MKNAFDLQRREFCVRGFKWIAAGAGMSLIASCGNKNSSGEGSASSAVTGGCVDPDGLSSAAVNLRESLNYEDVSSVANQTCAGCAFFTADDSGQCGNCQILQGTVNATGYCTSWSPKS